jgi:FkbM family methyltransferase
MVKKKFRLFKHIVINTKFFGIRYLIFNIPYQLLKFISKNKFSAGGEDKIREVNFYKMLLKDTETGIHSDLIREGKREPFATDILTKDTQPGEVILEIGANIGYYTILQSKKIGPKGQIYAIEPEKENFEYLKKNVKLNKLNNVTLFKQAIGDKNGELEIYAYEQGNLNSPFKWDDNYKGKEKVKEQTIDTFLEGKKDPNWIRMDVEGYEYNILIGAKKTLRNKNLKRMFIEFHFGMVEKQNMVDLLKMIRDSGFEIEYAIVEDKAISECLGRFSKLKKFFYKNRRKYAVLKNLKIDNILKRDDILDGHIGAFEIFLKRKD